MFLLVLQQHLHRRMVLEWLAVLNPRSTLIRYQPVIEVASCPECGCGIRLCSIYPSTKARAVTTHSLTCSKHHSML